MKYCWFLIPFVAFISRSHAAWCDEGIYKDWSYTPSRIIGLVKLTGTTARDYTRISAMGPGKVKVEEINPCGVTVTTLLATFANDKLSMFEYYNQWDNKYRVLKFTPVSENEFMVTDTRNGKNYLLPCKAMKYIFKNDLLAEIQYTGYDSALCNCQNGFAVDRFKRYDDKDRFGLQKEGTFFDDELAPAYSKGSDCHRFVIERDTRGNQISIAYYNEENMKLANRYGTWKNNFAFDSSDNETQWTAIGLNGEATNVVSGVAKRKNEYHNGLQVQTTFYDEKDKVARQSDTGTGIAIYKYEYNSKGRVTRESYFDEKGLPINNHSGMQEIRFTYSPSNMLLEEEYFNRYGKPAANREHIHHYVYKRDERGRLIQEAFFDTVNAPVKNRADKVYMIKYEYDDQGLLLTESYWQNDSIKMGRWDGYHKWGHHYNEEGQETDNASYDENDKPYVSSSGYSRTLRKYDRAARLVELSRFIENTPSSVTFGDISKFHSVKFSYDHKNRVTQIEYFDTAAKSTAAWIKLDGGFECHKIELGYVANKLTEERFYTTNSSYPFKTIDCVKGEYVDPKGCVLNPKIAGQ